MNFYNLINRITGTIIFIISALLYGFTIEPSISFWDCSEFITSASRLQVGHPPGAPIFMLLGNLFSHFASSPEQIPFMINLMNGILSAGTILLLYLTITHLVKKLLLKPEDVLSTENFICIIGSGIVGALIYAFSDTFWYSAVEGEVYAFSSFLTALTFWLILQWENEFQSVKSDRWLILLAYIIGISIGVHLLNLLCIPAIVMVYYFRDRKSVV